MYHSRQVLIKSVKSSSGSSRAVDSVFEAGGVFFSCGFRTFSLSKNTCHLLAFYLRYPQMYEHHVFWWHSKDFNDKTHLLVLIFSSKKRISHVKFCNYTSETPDIDFSIIWKSKNNFGSSIISALDISVNGLSFKTTRAKINNFDSWFIHLFEQNVLRFQICMNYSMFMKKMNAIENLEHKSSDKIEWKSIVTIRFYKFVEIHR